MYRLRCRPAVSRPRFLARFVAVTLLAICCAHARAGCVGDCTGDGIIARDDILSELHIALGNADVQSCTAGDVNSDHRITVDEILTAVNSGVKGCRISPTPTVPRCPGEVDCGNGVCCPSDSTCGNQGDCCPSGFPVDCGSRLGCCPAGATCGSQGDCCPIGFPVDCGSGNGCCPSGTRCGVHHCF